jgi:antirestriction protein ArdC
MESTLVIEGRFRHAPQRDHRPRLQRRELLLWCTAQERGYADAQWLTYQQAHEAGGQVRKGEKGSHIVFVSFLEKTNEKAGRVERVPFLKQYTVFNVAQCDGLVLKGDKPETINPDKREELADDFMKATGATIRYGESRAYFRRAEDFIMLPAFENFSSRDAYYETAFHELTHWTGHEPRLNRTFGKRFGDETYSAEELVAKLCSAFIMAECGFDSAQRDAAYIAHWIRFLTDHDMLSSRPLRWLRKRLSTFVTR